jgi:putative peptidoglycan lipid II flippase
MAYQARHFAPTNQEAPEAEQPEDLLGYESSQLAEINEDDASPAEAAVDQAETRDAQVGRSAALMSVLVIISRLTGFLRTWGQAYALGVTVTASCYSVANNLPNQLYELVIGGMLVTAFLPVYQSVKKEKGTKGASDYTSNLVSIVLVLMGAVTVLGIIFAAQVVWTQSFSASADFDADLATYFFRFFVIEVVLYALSSIFSGVLNAERDYFWSSAAPIFNNFVTTASFLAYAFLVDTKPQLALVLLALGNPLGVAVQVIMQMPSLRKHGIRLRPHINLRDPALKDTLSIGIPSLIVMVCSFVTVSVMNSSALSVTAVGASVSYYARLWYTLPYAILAVPITTAMFTELSDDVARGDMDSYREGVTSGTAKIIFLMIPFMMYLMVFASPLITMLAAGKFSDADIAMTASYLRALAASLPVYGVCMYLQKVCSSLRRMGLFAVANVVAAGIQVAICLFATPIFGLDMVAYSSAFFFLAVDIVTFASLRSTLKRVGLGSITASIVRAALFGLAGAVAGAGVLILLSRVIGPIGQSISRAFIFTVAGGIPSVIVTFGIALVTHSPETDVVRNLVGRLLRRR